MKTVRRIIVPILLLVLMSSFRVGLAYPRSPREDLQDLEAYIVRAMREWEVPGLALAIVKNDAVVLAKGYGVKQLGESAPVTERTIFAIGSASKAFTTAALAMLVEEGKLQWDDPVVKYLPDFQLFDPYVTRELTIRDLVTHRSGLERADLLWYGSMYEREEIVRRIRFLKPRWSFRSRFGYQNILYLVAGQVIRAVTGKTWDEVIRERIFQPLGMTASTTSVKALRAATDVATPHARVEDVVRPIPWRDIDNIAPAGSINSNVLEMTEWIRLHLNEGTYRGRRFWSAAMEREMQTPQTIVRPEPPYSVLFPEARFLTYGLGWFLHDYRGRKIVEHGGNIDGMSALVVLVPEEKFGFVILTNMNGTLLVHALKYRILDVFFGASPRDWSAEFLQRAKALQEQQQAAVKRIEEARVTGTQPALPRAQYIGTYENDVYGQVSVEEEAGKLVLRFGPTRVGDLEHWHYETFRVRWRDPLLPRAFAIFVPDVEGKISELRMRISGLFEDLAFKRISPREGER
ncbi:MAG: serine hydrolase [Blastocatellia bacterium]|nr:serine hydrolase [Blastocatellia bacterium]MCS7157174.1 serine hydrolase [Blastocatellia bacterium]MCX7752363.1 serine hydrolase [Blastocatellia bacterium]MDW8167244.1 serine hydrolase [Acidobacteriota bacterium]